MHMNVSVYNMRIYNMFDRAWNSQRKQIYIQEVFPFARIEFCAKAVTLNLTEVARYP